MHNYNGSSYDNLYPKTKSTIVIMNDGKTVEEAMALRKPSVSDRFKLKVDGSYDDGWTVQDWYDGNIVDPILDNNSHKRQLLSQIPSNYVILYSRFSPH